mmetsp:Transcript_66635/g.134325  ORF Transcript_66635/g.134325 Transcript_66635/m.134325 type:complete len:356 (-) Transcript_66635:284-1351(-)
MLSKDALDFSSDSEEEFPPETVAAAVAATSQNQNPLAVETSSNEWLDEPEDSSLQTQIQNRYVFWFMHRGSHKGGANQALDSFEQALIPVASFQTVEHFWRVYDHIARPQSIHTSGQTTYHLFKQGVKPTWEDPNNCRGGAWIVRLRKGLAARFWEELLLAVIGEQFDVGNEICGAKLSIRFNEDIISLWNRNADNAEANSKIRDLMRKHMCLPQFISMEYKRHEVSLVDKSSFRNTQSTDNKWPKSSTDGMSAPQGAGTAAVGSQHHGYSLQQAPQQGQPRSGSGNWGGMNGGSTQRNLAGRDGKVGGSWGENKGGGASWGKLGGGGLLEQGGGLGVPPSQQHQPARDLNAKWR